MKKLNRFFWWCAGTNIDVLEQSPTDHSKYFGVGATIVFTALMASFAGGYAFFTAFESIELAIFFGIFWGLLIFNLDRYIVSTIGRGDGTQKITKEEWKSAFPRLLMAVLLGFVIATPLELKIFEKEIQTVVERLKIEKGEELGSADISFNQEYDVTQNRLTKIESDLTELTNNKQRLTENAGRFYEERKQDILQDYKQKESELNTVQSRVNRFHSNYITAIRDSLPTTQVTQRKSIRDVEISRRNQLRNEKEILEKEIQDLTANRGSAIVAEQEKIDKQIALLINQKESLIDKLGQMEAIREAKRTSITNKTENYDGFAAHLEAMSLLTEIRRDENGGLVIPAMFYAKWLITILFIFIEVAPVLFKLMTEAGPYEDMMERIKHESKVKEKYKISEINDEINTSIKISTERNKSRLDAELKGNEELIQSIALAQADIAKRAVEKWKEQEIEKLDKSMLHIIKSTPEYFDINDKFWTLENGSEYCFRNGHSNVLWVKNQDQIKVGRWERPSNNKIVIEIENIRNSYNIENLTDKQLLLLEELTGEKLTFTLN